MSVLIVVHRPDRPDVDPHVIEVGARPYGELVACVREYEDAPGTVEAVLVCATRPPLHGRRAQKRGPVWGEWSILAWATNDGGSGRAVPMDPPDLLVDPRTYADL